MEKTFTLRYGDRRIEVRVPQRNLIYAVGPKDLPGLKSEEKSIRESLKNPIYCAPLSQQVKKGMKVVILGDDLTRPTPRCRILPYLLDELNDAGVPDKDVSVLIALGTHRYMDKEEIEICYGEEVVGRTQVLNHEWKDKAGFVTAGFTKSGVPAIVNKVAAEADYLIGVGSIVPHLLAGYGGGAKIVQPGICSWETTARTHMLPAEKDEFLDLVGEPENAVRLEIEEVAKLAGLDFIVNVVLNSKGEIVKVVSGDFVKAHREGEIAAKEIYEPKISELADIVIVNSYPAEIDYWQGIKALCHAQRGLRESGTIVLIAPFPEGASPTHGVEFEKYGDKSYEEIKRLTAQGKLDDLVCASTLLQHALLRSRSEIVCVSEGLSTKQKEDLALGHAESPEEALQIALAKQGKRATIGVIDYGGDVVPTIRE